jgi:hypothetical protein
MLSQRNKLGFPLDDGGYQRNIIMYDKKGSVLLTRLFELNPSLSAGYLYWVIEECIDVQANSDVPDDGQFDERWHVRRADSVSAFVTHLQKIIKSIVKDDPLLLGLDHGD